MDRNGEEQRISFNEGDYWYRPSVQYVREPIDPKDPKSKLIKVGIIRDNDGVDQGDIQYLTPFSVAKVQELSKYFKTKPGEAQTTFSIRREGHTNSCTCTYEDLINPNFNEVYDRLTKPAVSWDQFYKGMTQMTELETKIVKEKPYR